METQDGRPTVAAAIAGRLARYGTRFVFGYPGGETLDLLEAMRREGIEFVLTRHEATASFAALATGELTGRAGVCLATLGPGATNLVSGVAAALLERAPMLAVTAQLPRSRRESTTHQRLDLNALYAPITKGSFRIDPGDALRTLEKGLRLAVSGRPGPVHLEMPSDVPRAECADQIGLDWFGGSEPDKAAPVAPLELLRDAAGRIAAARRPAMLLGIGARAAGQPAVTAFAEAAELPVVVAPKAKGLLSENHPLFGGVIEMLGKQAVVDWLREADLLVYVGFDPVELDMLWEFRTPGVLLDTVPDTDAYYRTDIEVTGDTGANLRALARDPRMDTGARGQGDGRARAAALRDEISRRLEGSANPGLLAPREAIEAVRAAASSPRALAATDVGAHKMAAGQFWRTAWPGCFLMSNGQSSMGYGLPAAMAAKLLDRERQVVALIGDGGLGMYLGELETLARLGLGIPVVVFVDRQLSLIVLGQERRGYPRYGVDFGSPDYRSLAASLGGHGCVAGSAAQLHSEVAAGFGRDTFTLIAVPVDERLYRF
ncbi:MAG: thiamine pyrophosphate-binding protein [Bacillota bacterium]|nr:thiamine pyrophosphate-binding protein [Bacillota bacterium]